MDLDFTEEQDMLREMVRGLCAEYASIETVRAMEDDPKGYTSDFWKQLRPNPVHLTIFWWMIRPGWPGIRWISR